MSGPPHAGLFAVPGADRAQPVKGGSTMTSTGVMRCVLILVAACVAAAVPGQAAWGQDVVKIGVLAPFKTPSGEGLLNAANMAAEEINAAGGIGGKKVELILSNDEYKPEVGANAYKKLALSDKVVTVVGTASAGVALAVMDQVARYKVPFVSTGAASPQQSAKVEKEPDKFKYWFRVMHTSPELGGAVADWLVNYLNKKEKIRRVAMMVEKAIWTREIIDTWKQAIQDAGMELVVSETFDVETKDFTPILTKIMNSKAEFILEISAHVDGAIYVKQWAAMQGPPIGGVSGTAASSRFWRDTGGTAIGEVNLAMGSFRVALTPKSIPFYDKYVKAFGVSPDYTSGYTYDALYILKDAIERAKSTDPDALVKALEATNYVGAAGRWEFLPNHNAKFGPGYRQLPLVQWQKDGERKVIWPENIKTGDFIYPPWWKK